MERTFRSPTKSAKGFIKDTLHNLFAAVSIIFIIECFTKGLSLSRIIIHCISVTVGIIFFAICFLYTFNIPDYVVTENDVRFIRRGKTVKSFPFNECIFAFTRTKHTYMGITTHYTCILHTAKIGEPKNKMNLLSLNQDDFDDFFMHLHRYAVCLSTEQK